VVQCDPQPEDFVAILGQGPIGLMFTMLVKRPGARIAATDTIAERLRVAARCGAEFTWDRARTDVASEVKRLTGGAARTW
jgi:threonine dehydrogenase-like Zn-dependent dehydrogenase